MALSDNEKQFIFRDIWNGIINLGTLPVNLYNDISDNLKKGLFKGFGKNLSRLNIESPDFKTLTALNNNIHFFSAAKVFQQTNDIRNFLFDQEGFKRPFNAFAVDANKIYERYNVDWQRTEFDTTISQAQASAQWQEIQDGKEDLPLLQYQTAGDTNVRPEHAAWDNIIKPVNDPFWDSHMPPNGFNCFEPNTKILTPKGWKKISDIKKGDNVIGGSGKKRNVTGVHINVFKGKLIKLESKNASILCTPNHRILTTKGWLRAEQLKKSDIIIQQPESILQNRSIRNIDKANTFIGNVFVTLIVKWNSLMSKAFDPQFQFRDININPVRRNIITKHRIAPQRYNIIKHYLFTFGWFCFSIGMPFRMFFKELFACNSTFIHNILSFKRSRCFKFFRNSHKRRVSFFGLTQIMMRIVFEILCSLNLHSFALRFFSPAIVMPLGSNSLAAPSWFNTEMNKQSSNSPIVHIPSTTKHPESKHFGKVKMNQSIFSGAPFSRFNSLKDFIRYSLFHFKYVRLTNITNIPYTDNVHNLSVEEDESYITELGIVHNCRCIVIQLETGKETNLPEHLRKVKKKFPTVKSLENKEGLFRPNPGVSNKIFTEKGKGQHPYFNVSSSFKDLKDNHFNLPRP